MYIHSIKLDNQSDTGFSIEKPHGLIDHLYMVFKTPAILHIRAQVFSISAPSAVLIDSHTPYKYFSLSNHYEDDYYHFATKDALLLSETLIFPYNTPVVLSDSNAISEILHMILREYNQQNEFIHSEEIIALLTKYLMLKTGQSWSAMTDHNKETPHYETLLMIRKQIMEQPDKNWTISELAESVHLSPTYFQVLYRRTFGTSCINDVIDARVAQAKELLLSTGDSVNEISKQLGYNEACHFIRQFKKHVGLSPYVFRKKCR